MRLGRRWKIRTFNHKYQFSWFLLKKSVSHDMHKHLHKNILKFLNFIFMNLKLLQKQPFRDILEESCSKNMQQIYRGTPMPKCDFNKVAKQLYWNRTSAWVFCKFAADFQKVEQPPEVFYKKRCSQKFR